MPHISQEEECSEVVKLVYKLLTFGFLSFMIYAVGDRGPCPERGRNQFIRITGPEREAHLPSARVIGKKRRCIMETQEIRDYESLYQTLAGEILRFQRKPGEQLSEHELCRRFGLSRTPVRSLLQRLQENGLVQIIPRSGSRVTRLDMKLISQLIYERVAVETMVMRDFAAVCRSERAHV